MNRQRQCNTQATQHQRGAVAIIVAISIFVLVGMLGLVLDLGHLYVAKTELQNAADAAALSGAKELKGTVDGVDSALTWAHATALQNNYDLNATPVSLDAGNLEFSTSSDGPWASFAEARANPNGMTFLKVDTSKGGTTPQSFNTWFIQVLGAASIMHTFGLAVAGPVIQNVAPIGICAIDHNTPGDGVSTYYGFDKGVGYDLAKINDLLQGLGKGTPLWLHPTAQTEDQCKDSVSFASDSKFRPFLCLGKSAIGTSSSIYVFANTGWEAAQEGPINTRFRNASDSDAYFKGMTAELCSPDLNVKQFLPSAPQLTGPQCDPLYCGTFTNKSACNAEALALCQWSQSGGVCQAKKAIPSECNPDPDPNVDWLTYIPTQQGANLVPAGEVITDTFGASVKDVIATYIRPTDQSILNPTPLTVPPFPKAVSYPPTSPYHAGIADHAKLKYYEAPYTAAGVTPTEGRRLINLVVVDCSNSPVPHGVCAELPKLGVAQFFMPVRAKLSGSTGQSFYLEFIRELPSSALTPEIRLFK